MTFGKFALSLGATLALVASSAHAAAVSYTIDASQSSLVLGGALITYPLTEQQPGSLVASYSGTLSGDLTGGTLTFSGGNSIVGAIHPLGPFNPVNGNTGTDVYGFNASTFIQAALYNIQLDFVGGTVQNGVVPSTLDIGFIEDGNGDGVGGYRSNLGSGDLTGSQLNLTNLPASLTTNGNIETVIIPIFSDNPVESNNTPIGSLTLTGQIVATRVIPEPGTLVLASVGGAFVALTYWRRRRA